MRPLIPLLIAASFAAACGEDVPDRAVERDTPAITSPGTTIPYESGGGDGSGADGSEKANERGGIAAGPDRPGPQDSEDADTGVAPTEGSSDE